MFHALVSPHPQVNSVHSSHLGEWNYFWKRDTASYNCSQRLAESLGVEYLSCIPCTSASLMPEDSCSFSRLCSLKQVRKHMHIMGRWKNKNHVHFNFILQSTKWGVPLTHWLIVTVENLGVGGIFCIQGKNDKLFSQGIILINVNFWHSLKLRLKNQLKWVEITFLGLRKKLAIFFIVVNHGIFFPPYLLLWCCQILLIEMSFLLTNCW